jgi:hypothetical protein
MQPKILYLLQARTGQSHTMCTLSSFSYPHSRHSCPSVFCIYSQMNIFVAIALMKMCEHIGPPHSEGIARAVGPNVTRCQ